MTAIRSTEEKVRSEPTLRSLVEQEALEANRATPFLNDDTVSEALSLAGKFLRQARASVLAANCADCELAADKVDAGTLDRLRLNPARIDAIAAQTELTAAMAPLERDVESWILPNGLRVTERRIPIGTVGANFEARPNVAVDVAAQLLKSLNTVVLRTGGAALRTVTVLVDEILRPALEATGIPGGAVGLVRSADHDGARALVSLPRRIPLVILRGSGKTTAALGRLAAENGVRTLAHAQGGGVLYVHEAAAPDRALAIAEASLDRLGVCNRLNLLLVDLGATNLLPKLMALLAEKGIAVRGTSRVSEHVTVEPLDRPLGYEWANDPERVATVSLDLVNGLDEAVRLANEETSGLSACIVTEDPAAAERFLQTYRGTAAFWHATTRFTDGFELTGVPETGVNVEWAPGPRGPVTYRDLWLRQYRVVGDATQTR